MTQEEQKIQELLKPRFKVIGPYPFSPYRVGDLVRSTKHDSFHITTTGYRNEFGDDVEQENFTQLSIIEEYPNLFRRLHWWEKRDENEMPEYVKPDPNGALEQFRSQKTIYKVRRWVRDDDNLWCKVGDHAHIHVNHILPATSSEYNNYNNAQKIQL